MRYLLASVGVLLIVVLYRSIAIGRKNALTMSEQRKAAFGDLPVAYKVTQPRNRWTLRIARTAERRRSA